MLDPKKSDEAPSPKSVLRVMISEDDLRGAKLAASVLESAGFTVQYEVTDSEKARAADAITRPAAIVESSDDAIVGETLEGVITSWNQGAEKLYGYSAAEVVGEPIFLLAPPSRLEEVAPILAGLKRGERVEHFESIQVRKDGTLVDVSLSIFPIIGSHGEVTGVASIARDITGRKRAEEAVSKSEKGYRTLFENSPVGIYRTTPEGRILAGNPALVRMLGYSSFQELAARDLNNQGFEPVYRRSEFVESLEKQGEINGLESAWRRRDGSVLHVRENARAISNGAGKVLYYEGTVEDITDRKQAEKILEERTAYLNALIEHTPLAIVVVDANECVRMCNPAFERLYQYRQDEIVGMPLNELIAPPELLAEADNYSRRSGEGKSITGITRRRRKDGTLMDVEIHGVPLMADGRYVGTYGLYQDITERKRAEEALRQSEERFRQIAETIDEVYWMADPNNDTMLYVSPAYQRVWGRSCASLYARPRSFLDAVYPADRRHVVARLQDQKAGRTIDHEYRIAGPEGAIRWIWDRGFPVRNEVGQVVRYVGVAVDITERKRAEAEKVRLVTAIEHSAEGVVITNPAGNIEYVNPAFTGMTGYSREEVLGKNPRILKSEKQNPEYYHQLWAAILRGEPWHGELINRRKDGTLYHEEMNIAPVRGPLGEITHFIATKQDVTERKSLELQLQQAAKMEGVGRLAGGIAHDFNKLLTVINGYSEILLERFASNDNVSVYLKEIKDAGDRAASLTRQLLAFSRRQVLAPQVLSLNAVVGNLEKMLRRLIGEDVKLRIACDPSLGRVKADPGQVEQVIMNLAVNARDAMPVGGDLTIETRNVDLDENYARTHVTVKPGAYVMLAVSDTGTGMSPETQVHIFEPFFTTKGKGKGTGLGLATVYGIVKQSGGNIWVYSELGQGTVFKIYFPRVSENLPAAGHATPEATIVLGSETILVIEDEEGVRSMVHFALKTAGYHVLEADGADKALALCAQYSGPIHLVLADVVMPKMSGPLIAEKVTTLRPGVKVLFMSGYTDDAVVLHGVLSHDTPFIQKPFSPMALRMKIREVLGENSKKDLG